MADIAALGIKVDSDGVVKGAADLDKFAASADKAGRSADLTSSSTVKMAQGFANTQSRAATAAGSTMRLAEGFDVLTGKVNNNFLAINKNIQALERVTPASAQAAAALNRVGAASTASAGAIKANTGNIAAQFQDIGVTAAMGMNPLLIALQQGTQLSAVFAQSGGSALQQIGGALKQVLNPTALLTLGLVALAAAGIQWVTAALSGAKATDEAGRASRSLSEVLLDTASSYDEVMKALADYNREQEKSREVTLQSLAVQASAIEGNLREAISVREKTKAIIEGYDAVLRNPIAAGQSGNAVLVARSGFASDLAAQDAELARLSQAAKNTAIEIATEVARIGSDAGEQLKLGFEILRNEAKATIPDIGALSQRLLELNRQEAKALDTLRESERVRRPRREQLTEEQKALKQRNDETVRFISALEDEIKKVGLDAAGIRQLEIDRAKEVAVTAEQTAKLTELNFQREDAIRLEEKRKAVADANKSLDSYRATTIAQLDVELQTMELIGFEREREILRLSHQAEIAAINVQIRKAEVDQNWALVEVLRRQAEAADEAYGKSGQIVNVRERTDEATKAAQKLNEQFSALNNTLGNLSLGPLGDLVSALSNKNPVASLLGMGGIGTMIGLLTKDGQQAYTQQRKAIEAGLVSVFGEKASGLAKTLSGFIQAAGTGSMAADTILGQNRNTTSKIGSALGGIGGQILGEALKGAATKAFGAAIGSVVPVVGTLIGGVIGGLIGSIFGGTPKGAVTINGNRITGTVGKGDQLTAATQAGDAIIGSLANIAKMLGGTVGTVRGVTIGMRKDDYIVDPTGQGRVKGSGVMNFGKDAEAAALAATKLLIERGVIQGIRASTQNILRAGSDLEAQLNKAVAFEAVFKELAAASNPFAASLKEMQAGFTELTAIFVEAKASAEEYAQLQEFIALRQKQLIDQAMSNYRSTFYSDAENTAYARQTISNTLTPLGYGNIATVAQYRALVEATDALANPELFGALMELADEFGTLQQAAENAKQAAEAAAAAQEALNAQRGQMEVQLLRLQGKEVEAVAKARQLELAAMDPSLRALQQQINLWTDIAAAQDVLRTAYEREKGALEETAEALSGLGDTLRDFRKSLDADDIGSNPAAIAARFREVSRMASLGDQTAMGNLPQSARDYLDSVRSNARNEQEYLRALAEVRRATDSAIGAADIGVTEAERQLEQMKLQVGALIDINDNVITVAQAIERLTALWNPASPGTPTPIAQSNVRDREDERDQRMQGNFDRLGESFRSGLEKVGIKQDAANQMWRQITAGVLPITVRTDPIEPLEVVTP